MPFSASDRLVLGWVCGFGDGDVLASRRLAIVLARTSARRDRNAAARAANCGLLGRLREIIRFEDLLVVGPGGLRTANQTVMSAVTLSEISMKSGVFHHSDQRMFTIGCGQALAKRWSAVVEGLATHHVRDAGVAGSNPATKTKQSP